MSKSRRRKWAVTALAALALLALAGMALSSWLLSRWGDVRVATAEEARRVLDAAAAAGAGPAGPYLEIGPGGLVTVHREQEGPRELPLSTLHVLAFDPARGQLVSADLPWWFVRAKMTRTINLGTLASALARDWEHLDLSVTEDDLERRGPGLILDHRTAAGGRLVLWTE